jgi:hypothetical protein
MKKQVLWKEICMIIFENLPVSISVNYISNLYTNLSLQIRSLISN